ncbi:hypothetical protein BCY91_08590 [Pelobium manganitolerans]|uniref:N-acetyltransferase domain-containing protein n=1 Tax=Pelobium manganitolerans TaxID=1842495 RepID=A0A419S4C5_9SPHI|nr:GNAT family N-acetyltransferase [Pelobium manganitolerans]RKD14517.1 hypothetical protein BCY91_08590 [Pelobium manganitolerans]
MTILEVNSAKTRKEFLDVARVIYKDDPVWVCPLDQDIETIFDPKKNSFFTHGKAKRWILKDGQNRLIGRIAAFINDKKAYTFEKPTGGIGFVESFDNAAAFNLLFDTAKEWLKQQGMEAMTGPINFGENDMFWGLLVDGFTHPSYGMNYNKPYYLQHFKNYGFRVDYEQLTNHLDLHKEFPERFTKIAEWVAKKPGYVFKYLDPKNFDQFAEDFVEIYNDGWKNFTNFSPIKIESVKQSFEKMKAIMDPKLIWFAYINGEPASFIVMLPDANLMIKPLNGKLDLIGKLKFLYKKLRGVNRMRAVVMGTKEKFQKHGLESAMFIKLKEYVLPKNQYDELELSWVGDFNDKMLAIHSATGSEFGKKHATLICDF